MSFRDFLDSECGQLNPVLKVASHFTQDVTLRDSLGGAGPNVGAGPSGRAVSQNDPYLQDYLDRSHQEVAALPPTSFQMDSLLREIQSLEHSGGSRHSRPIPAPAVADYAKQGDWAAEFLKNEHSTKVSGAAWAGDYFAAELDPIWDEGREPYSLPIHHTAAGPHQTGPMVNYPPGPMSIGPIQTGPTAKELLDDAKWADDFTGSVNPQRTELMTTADELLKTVNDPDLQATEFMKFVEKLSTGEVDLTQNQEESGKQDHGDVASNWAQEYNADLSRENVNPTDWAQEFATQSLANPSGLQDEKEDFWAKLQEEWDRLAQEDSANHPWLENNQEEGSQEYSFAQNNPFDDVADPLSEGKKKLLEGDIPSAVLLFESAVQKFPDNPECWLLLGTTQAQNEQDPQAILALNKCLTIEPSNLNALMALAASLTNESYHLQAANALKRWLKYNPKYSHLVDEDVVPIDSKTTSILPSAELSLVQQMYMQAARLNPSGSIDPDVQSGLGILFNLGSEYEKAADCFQAALNVNPDDSLLWNRLGATLANGGKSAEAIGAYRRSLEISPGCIRTRYNLGISCVNLGAYKEAAEHFISSLNIQAAGQGDALSTTASKQNVMSDSIWSSLRMILHLLDRSDLTYTIDSRDLAALNRHFQVQA